MENYCSYQHLLSVQKKTKIIKKREQTQPLSVPNKNRKTSCVIEKPACHKQHCLLKSQPTNGNLCRCKATIPND
ncbi:hypothetical protein ST37_03885 [Vibrio sp. qd031]|nr:hypothetical protein ST37_03885 [Vibrio sp. qd031]